MTFRKLKLWLDSFVRSTAGVPLLLLLLFSSKFFASAFAATSSFTHIWMLHHHHLLLLRLLLVVVIIFIGRRYENLSARRFTQSGDRVSSVVFQRPTCRRGRRDPFGIDTSTRRRETAARGHCPLPVSRNHYYYSPILLLVVFHVLLAVKVVFGRPFHHSVWTPFALFVVLFLLRVVVGVGKENSNACCCCVFIIIVFKHTHTHTHNRERERERERESIKCVEHHPSKQLFKRRRRLFRKP